MATLVFKCDSCAKALAVPEQAAERRVACPDCAEEIAVPLPMIHFECAACNAELCAPRGLSGDSLSCPECQATLVVPRHWLLRCPGCNTNLELDDDLYGDLAGKPIACPQCHADVPIPPVDPELAARKAAPPALPKEATEGLPGGFSRKTMKLDEMLENIPQAKALEDGKCPYCGTALNKMHDRAYLCKNCGRVIRMIRRTLK